MKNNKKRPEMEKEGASVENSNVAEFILDCIEDAKFKIIQLQDMMLNGIIKIDDRELREQMYGELNFGIIEIAKILETVERQLKQTEINIHLN